MPSDPGLTAVPASKQVTESADELLSFIGARLDERERVAKAAADAGDRWRGSDSGIYPSDEAQHPGPLVVGPYGYLEDQYAEHIALHDPAGTLADITTKRRILTEHAPEWRTVEWPHDQNGKGEAQVCRRCQNAEYTEWHPEVGQAGVLPEGFVAPYVLAPCQTVRLLALPHDGHPDYKAEWRPA